MSGYNYANKPWYKKKGPFERECKICQVKFLSDKVNTNYCSLDCKGKYRAYSDRRFVASPGTTGAIAELYVSGDLMEKGFEVYRALSPSSSCDILALKDGISYRFEVRTGRYLKERLTYHPYKIKAENLAVITFSDNKIHYIPELTY